MRVTAGENAIAEGVEDDSVSAKNSVQETLKGRNSVDSMSKITGARKLKHTDSLPQYAELPEYGVETPQMTELRSVRGAVQHLHN